MYKYLAESTNIYKSFESLLLHLSGTQRPEVAETLRKHNLDEYDFDLDEMRAMYIRSFKKTKRIAIGDGLYVAGEKTENYPLLESYLKAISSAPDQFPMLGSFLALNRLPHDNLIPGANAELREFLKSVDKNALYAEQKKVKNELLSQSFAGILDEKKLQGIDRATVLAAVRSKKSLREGIDSMLEECKTHNHVEAHHIHEDIALATQFLDRDLSLLELAKKYVQIEEIHKDSTHHYVNADDPSNGLIGKQNHIKKLAENASPELKAEAIKISEYVPRVRDEYGDYHKQLNDLIARLVNE